MVYNILVCDDEKDIVNALRIYLEAEGYCVFAAYNGWEALEVLAQHEIHLVLMDIMMPVMDGIAAMAQMRQTVLRGWFTLGRFTEWTMLPVSR